MRSDPGVVGDMSTSLPPARGEKELWSAVPKMGDGTAGQRWDVVRVMTLLPIFDVHEIAEGVHST